MSTQADKTRARQHLKTVLNGLPADDVSQKSALIASRLFVSRWWDDADTVFAFCSLPREAQTDAILTRAFEQVKTVGVPRVDGKALVFHRLKQRDADFSIGPFGIREPWPDWPMLDICEMRVGSLLIIVPGLGFDRSRHRLGRGKGFYDRFLRTARAHAPDRIHAVGVCFSDQLLDRVPVDGHDVPVDGIITECETIYAKS